MKQQEYLDILSQLRGGAHVTLGRWGHRGTLAQHRCPIGCWELRVYCINPLDPPGGGLGG